MYVCDAHSLGDIIVGFNCCDLSLPPISSFAGVDAGDILSSIRKFSTPIHAHASQIHNSVLDNHTQTHLGTILHTECRCGTIATARILPQKENNEIRIGRNKVDRAK